MTNIWQGPDPDNPIVTDEQVALAGFAAAILLASIARLPRPRPEPRLSEDERLRRARKALGYDRPAPRRVRAEDVELRSELVFEPDHLDHFWHRVSYDSATGKKLRDHGRTENKAEK